MPMTDRELMIEAREQAEAERYAMQEVQQWQAQGLGAAMFAVAMWDGLGGADFSREERLALVQAALRGR
jgi:hypothetical protein